jgi:hypothetical protein
LHYWFGNSSGDCAPDNRRIGRNSCFFQTQWAGSGRFCIESGIAVNEVIDYNLPVNKKVALSRLSVKKQSRSRELSEDGQLPIFFLFLGLCLLPGMRRNDCHAGGWKK